MAFEPVSAVLGLGEKLIDRFFPNPKDKAEALQKLREMEQAGDLQVIANQIDVNKVEAASSSVFVSGWRPFIGWVCGSALSFQLVIAPLVSWGAVLANHPVSLPIMQTELLTTLLVGMLGLGGMRTVEKLQGVATK